MSVAMNLAEADADADGSPVRWGLVLPVAVMGSKENIPYEKPIEHIGCDKSFGDMPCACGKATDGVPSCTHLWKVSTRASS